MSWRRPSGSLFVYELCDDATEDESKAESDVESDDESDDDDDSDDNDEEWHEICPGWTWLSLTLCTAPPRTQKSSFIIQQICIFCQNYNLM